jgi:hypothetical protein
MMMFVCFLEIVAPVVSLAVYYFGDFKNSTLNYPFVFWNSFIGWIILFVITLRQLTRY